MLFKVLLAYGLSFLVLASPSANAGGRKAVPCSFSYLPIVKVAYSKLSILHFGSRPVKVLAGEESFDVTFIKNDLALKALKPNRSTNLFVYLKDQTCAFRLRSVPKKGDEIILVKGTK